MARQKPAPKAVRKPAKKPESRTRSPVIADIPGKRVIARLTAKNLAGGYPDNNPKSAVARLKPGIHAIPFSALLHLGAAMADGKRKYGLANWRGNSVAASVYVDAMFRHIAAWWDAKEEVASDSLAHHLGHVMACCSIILDAQATGNLIDDRPQVAGQWAKIVQEIIEREKTRLDKAA
jgi:hypothetical protein